MSPRVKLGLIFFLLFLSVPTFLSAEPDPKNLLEKMDLVLRGQSHEMTVRLDVKTKSWRRNYVLHVWMKGQDYAFARVLEPAKSRGQGFLRVKAKLWQYMPTAERTILIPPSLMLDRFMGSDFTNDDFVKLTYLPRDYEAKMAGEANVAGADCWRLELMARPEAPVIYGMLRLWLRKEDSVPMKWKFFNEKQEHLRTLEYSEIKDMNGHVIPTVWRMANERDKTRETVVTVTDAHFDIPIPDSIFTRQNLEKGG